MASERRKRGADNRTTTVLLILWASSCAGLQLDCGPGGEANEGSDHTLTCDGIQSGQNVYWIKKDSLVGDTAVANCSASRICDNNFQTRYEVTRASDATSSLKILGVTRGDHKVGGEWTCSSSSTTAACVVSVVYPPDIGSCEVRFDESSGQVLGECVMHKVYPKPTCNWFQQLQGGQATNISANQTSLTSTQYVDASNSQIYFRATCHLHCPLPVTPGNYSYKVAITPGSVERQVAFTSTSIVSLPTSPRLSVSCPAGYVTDAEASSCTCITSDLGSPSASLAWLDPDGNTVLSGATLTLALPFSSVTPAYNGRTYQCAVLHHTGESRVPYTPLIAARPDRPEINETASGDVIQLFCSSSGGQPTINRVIFTCPGLSDQPDTRNGNTVTSPQSLTKNAVDKRIQCTCYAENDFFASVTVLHVLSNSDGYTSDGSENTTMTYIIVGSVLGSVVFFSVLFALLSWHFCQKSKHRTPDEEDPGYERLQNIRNARREETVPERSPTSPQRELEAGAMASSALPGDTKEHEKSAKSGTAKGRTQEQKRPQPEANPYSPFPVKSASDTQQFRDPRTDEHHNEKTGHRKGKGKSPNAKRKKSAGRFQENGPEDNESESLDESATDSEPFSTKSTTRTISMRDLRSLLWRRTTWSLWVCPECSDVEHSSGISTPPWNYKISDDETGRSGARSKHADSPCPDEQDQTRRAQRHKGQDTKQKKTKRGDGSNRKQSTYNSEPDTAEEDTPRETYLSVPKQSRDLPIPSTKRNSFDTQPGSQSHVFLDQSREQRLQRRRHDDEALAKTWHGKPSESSDTTSVSRQGNSHPDKCQADTGGSRQPSGRPLPKPPSYV